MLLRGFRSRIVYLKVFLFYCSVWHLFKNGFNYFPRRWYWLWFKFRDVSLGGKIIHHTVMVFRCRSRHGVYCPLLKLLSTLRPHSSKPSSGRETHDISMVSTTIGIKISVETIITLCVCHYVVLPTEDG